MLFRVCTFAPIFVAAAARILAAGLETAPSTGVGGANVDAVAATAVTGGEAIADESAPTLPPDDTRPPPAAAQP
jgi:hypothetical protein